VSTIPTKRCSITVLCLTLPAVNCKVRRGSLVENATGAFRMYFIRKGDDLLIASDRVKGVPYVPMSEFHAAVLGFLDSALAAVMAAHHEVQNGEFWRRVVKSKCRGRH